MRGRLTQVPPEIRAKKASRLHLLTIGCVPWTVEGLRWACASLVEPAADPIPFLLHQRGPPR